MCIKDKNKKIISVFVLLALLFQFIPGVANDQFATSNNKLNAIERVNEIPEDVGLVKLEVLKDPDGNANVTEDSITWKIIYNSDKNSLDKRSFELAVSDGMELEHIDNQGEFDIESQPLFRGESFEQFDSEISDGDRIEYSSLEENINNKNQIKSFSRVDDNTYKIIFSETEETQEIIFTMKLNDVSSNQFSSHIINIGEEDESYIEVKSSATVRKRPSAKIDLPVNISWEKTPEGLNVPDIEISLVESDQLIDNKILVSGSGFTIFENLYKYDIDGNELDYQLKQTELNDYKTVINGFDIENIYLEQEKEKNTEKNTEKDTETDIDIEKEIAIEVEDELAEIEVIEDVEKESENSIDSTVKIDSTEGLKKEDILLESLSIMPMSFSTRAALPVDTKNYVKIHVTYQSDSSDPSSPVLPLPGARFLLEPSSGNGVTLEGTTDDAGILVFKNIPLSTSDTSYTTYKLTQIQAPFGYVRDSVSRTISFPKSSPRLHVEEYSNEFIPPKPSNALVFDYIYPEYERDKTGINAGTYAIPYHQTNGISIEEELYRNRDNIDDLRHTDSKYTIPAYSKHKFGQNIDMSGDRDVIEDDKAYIWKTATPTGTPGEYFIDLVVEGKEPKNKIKTDVVLVLDISGSMNHISQNDKTRIQNLREGVNGFIDSLDLSANSGIRVGIVPYAFQQKPVLPLTNDKVALKNFANGLTAAGATFTQRALIQGNELLRDSVADYRILVLVSDGEPTVSFRVNNLSENGSISSDNNWDQTSDQTLYHAGERDYSNAFNRTEDYPVGTIIEAYKGVNKRSGSWSGGKYYGLSPTGIREERSYDVYFDDTNIKKTISNHGLATVSEAESIKNHGIDIISMAVELNDIDSLGSNDTYYTPGKTDPVNPQVKTGVLKDISTGTHNYFDIDDASQIGDALSQIAPYSDKSVLRGKVIDPMGSQMILGKSEDGTFNVSSDDVLSDGNYHLSASDNSLLSTIILNKDDSDTINMSELNLGKNEWVKLRYKVNLRTELDGEGSIQDPNFEEKFYLTNGEDTTLTPSLKAEEQYSFGVPAIKLNSRDIEIKKNWVGFFDSLIPNSADFKLEKSVDGLNWIEVDTITLTKPSEPDYLRNWSKKIENLIRYDNEGNEYQYRVTELTEGNFTTTVETVEQEDGNYQFHFTNTHPGGSFIKIEKQDKKTSEKLSGAEFTLYRDPELTLIVNSVTTGVDGMATFNNLLDGTYYLKETSAPEGYVVIDDAIEINLNEGNVSVVGASGDNWEWVNGESSTDTINLKAYNEKRARLVINKTDTNGLAIVNNTAIFAIYEEADFTVDENTGKIKINEGAIPFTTVETDISTGIATTENIFKPGKYALAEKKSPQGFKGLKEPVLITLDGDIDSWTFTWSSEDTDNSFMDNYSGEIYVMNETFFTPNTGGIGGFVFAISGALIMVVAYIIRRKNKLKQV